MKRFRLLLLVLTMALPMAAQDETKSTDGEFDWEPVMNAIAQIESHGQPNARNGQYLGILQIAPVLVRECNNILRSRGRDKQYSLADRYNVEKSKEMFLLIQSQYNKTNDVEKAIRTWNGGPRYSVRATNGYYQKVLRRMR